MFETVLFNETFNNVHHSQEIVFRSEDLFEALFCQFDVKVGLKKLWVFDPLFELIHLLSLNFLLQVFRGCIFYHKVIILKEDLILMS